MTNHLTQAAAARCADLANSVARERGGEADWIDYGFRPDMGSSAQESFRRYVETLDARDREVLALVEDEIRRNPVSANLEAIRYRLRADLLPEPEPTLLEEFHINRGHRDLDGKGQAALNDFADWIAKRGVEVKPKGGELI